MVDVYYKKGGDFQNSRVKTSEKLLYESNTTPTKVTKVNLVRTLEIKTLQQS